MRRIIHSEQAPKAIGPYSQAVFFAGHDILYCSGQIGIDPSTGELVHGGIEAQTRQALENLKAVLTAAELSMSNVLRTTLYLVEMTDFNRVNLIYAEFFAEHPPARVTIGVAALPKGARVEVDAIAGAPRH